MEASSKTGGVTDGGQTDNMKCDTNIEGSRWGHEVASHTGMKVEATEDSWWGHDKLQGHECGSY